MTEDQDNAGEVVAGTVRVALTAAGQLAEQAARRREAALREAERDSAARVATLQSQLAAEREVALRSVRDVVQRGDAATVEEVARAWEQARSWDDPTMGLERAQLEERIRERFGVDPRYAGSDRSAREQVAAAALSARDIGLQADDAFERSESQSRGTALRKDLRGAGIDEEAVSARALAAESHPTPMAYAAQQRGAAAAMRRPGNKRSRAVEVEGPGR